MKHHLLLLILLLSATAAFAQTAFEQEISEHREKYAQDFLTDEHSPLKGEQIAHLAFYAADPAWNMTARVERTPDAENFDMVTYSGQTRPYRKYADLYFEKEGELLFKLEVYQNIRLITIEGYEDHLFLPFKDLTNGEDTYGGGRYLDLSISDIQDDLIEVDFNKCYNPWCAYSDGYSCPIPPDPNHLDMELKAGEKVFVEEESR